MAHETYNIPKSPTAFYHFQRNAIELCTANAITWSVPANTITDISILQTSYLTTYSVTANRATQSPAATAARDAAAAPLHDALEDMYNKYLLNNSAIDADDKAALHINQTGGGGKSASAPVTAPIVMLVSETLSTLYVVYSDSASPQKHHKPANVAFAEVCYKVGDPAPTSPSDCPERFNAARSHEPIMFEPSQRGLICYGFARWINKNDKAGPWSNVFSQQIP